MTFVVTEACIRCKYTDCVDVCPVDAFCEGPNFLVINPDECIDCAVCVPECPVAAIYAEEDVPKTSATSYRSTPNWPRRGNRSPGPNPRCATPKPGARCRKNATGSNAETSTAPGPLQP